MELVERVAAIDVGSNAIRLVVGRILHTTDRRIMKREASYRIPLRLGEDVFSHGEISPAKQEKLVDVFLAFRHLLTFFAPLAMRACATSAMREARNGEAMTRLIQERSGIQLEIISGREEATLLFDNHPEEASFLEPGQACLYMDVGGGSTELTLMVQGKTLMGESFRIGTVRMLQEQVEESEWKRMRTWIRALPEHLEPAILIGAGGNIGKISDLLQNQSEKQLLSRKAVRGLITKMEKMDYTERMLRYGLKPDRADVIVPAGQIFLQVMQWASIKHLLVPKTGVADGVLYALCNQ